MWFHLYLLSPLPSFLLSLSPFSLKKANIGFEQMFEEVPIVIKNSHLINVLMWELEDKSTVADKHELLNLSSRSDMSSCSHLPQGPKARHLGCKKANNILVDYTFFSRGEAYLDGFFFWRVINICFLTFSTALVLLSILMPALQCECFGFLPDVVYTFFF